MDKDEYEIAPGSKAHRRAPRARPLTQHVPVRFDAETIAQVRLRSDDDGMTVSSWIRNVVRRELARRNGMSNVTVNSAYMGAEDAD